MTMDRLTTDEMAALDARVFARNGSLGRSEHVFRYRDPSGQIEQAIDVAWTPCNFGGQRPWFRCPDCGRRALILYAGSHYACRQCHGLYYECQRSRGRWSALTKLQRLRIRLGGSASLSEPFPKRPKGMHHATYEQLKRQAEQLETDHVAVMREQMAWDPHYSASPT